MRRTSVSCAAPSGSKSRLNEQAVSHQRADRGRQSTVASALAATFRKSGRSVAVVDLDRLYMMLDDPAPMSDPSHSREARRAAAALTDHFVLDGIELVILEGTSWTMSERDELTSRLTTLVRPAFLT